MTRTSPPGSSTTIDWSAAARWYDANAARFVRTADGIAISPHLHAFAARLPAGGRVCDAGCGSGRDAAWLLDRGFDVTGIDLSAAMVAAARAKCAGRGTFHVADLGDLPAPADGFHGIWAFASLLHLPKARAPDVLRRMVARLASGGALCLSVKQGTGEAIDSAGRPMAFYAPDEISALTDAAGAVDIDLGTEDGTSSTGPVTWLTVHARRPS